MTREEKVNLLNVLLEIEEKNDIGNLTSTDRREFQQWVEDLEQEPKTGRWVIKAEGFPPEPITVCSECGFDKDYSIRPKYFHRIKYCPNCGAKMESEDKKCR